MRDETASVHWRAGTLRGSIEPAGRCTRDRKDADGHPVVGAELSNAKDGSVPRSRIKPLVQRAPKFNSLELIQFAAHADIYADDIK
jgi:hypothetical protein